MKISMTYHIINLEESSLGPIRDNVKHTHTQK